MMYVYYTVKVYLIAW